MATSLTTQLVVRLVDQASGPARGISAALMGLNNRLRGAIERNNAALDGQYGRLVEAFAAFHTLKGAIMAPVQAATDFQSRLEDIAQKAELSAPQVAALSANLMKLSREMGKAPTELATGLDYLLGVGLSADKATAILPAIVKTADAYRSTVEDVSKAGFAAVDNLKVPVEDFARALDIMARSGKEGAFELRDMAAEFPSLTAAAAGLGMKGTDAVARLAAALQIARKGAGTSSEAATNTANLLQKISAPATVRKFKAMGIDIRKELKKVQAEGGDVFEFIAKRVNDATKGDLSKLGDLFEDAQVQNFLRPLIQNLDEYIRIRDEAGKAKGVVDDDYATRMKTFAGAQNAFNAAVERAKIAIGTGLLPALTSVIGVINPLLERVEQLATAYPRVTAAIFGTIAALIALRVATIGVGYVYLLAKGALLQVALAASTAATAVWGAVAAMTGMVAGKIVAGFAALRTSMLAFVAAAQVIGTGGALKMVGASLLSLLSPIALVKAAFIALRFALLATGIGAVVTAIAAAGMFIYQNWSGLGEMFAAFGARLQEAFPALTPIFEGLKASIQTIVEWAGKLMAPLDMTSQAWRDVGTNAANAVIGIINKLIEFLAFIAALPGKIIEALGDAGTLLYNWGVQLIQGLINGIKSKIGELGGMISGALGSIGLGKGGMPPGGGLGAGELSGAPDGARARGGPVTKGNSYIVGEKGEEIFTANRNGTIVPNHALGGGIGDISFAPSFTISGAQDPAQVAALVRSTLDDYVRTSLRGVFADTGVRLA